MATKNNNITRNHSCQQSDENIGERNKIIRGTESELNQVIVIIPKSCSLDQFNSREGKVKPNRIPFICFKGLEKIF